MTDHQTMIREVCERVSGDDPLFWRERNGVVQRFDPSPTASVDREDCDPWHDGTAWVPFDPLTDYNDCHLLIDWMAEVGWYWGKSWATGYVYFRTEGEVRNGHADPDFRIAVLTAAWRALTNG